MPGQYLKLCLHGFILNPPVDTGLLLKNDTMSQNTSALLLLQSWQRRQVKDLSKHTPIQISDAATTDEL
jgi:hypothetical protein